MVNLYKYLRSAFITDFAKLTQRSWTGRTLSSMGSTSCSFNYSTRTTSIKYLSNKLEAIKGIHQHKSSRSIHTSRPNCGSVVPFKLSDIGEGIKEVTIKEWFVKVGDKVNQFDQICEVQSDKASVTITSRFDGIIKTVHYKVDEMALVGESLVDIELLESDSANSVDNLREVQEGDAIQVGRSEESIRLPEEASSSEKVLATPAVRRIATEYNVDLKDVEGTGKDGRVLKEDVQNFIDKKVAKEAAPAKPVKSSPIPATKAQATDPKEAYSLKSIPTITSVSVPDKKEPIKGYTKTMIKTMTAANSIPHFGYCEEIDLTELIKVKKEFQKMSAEYGIKITYMPFFVKSASLALSHFPVLNSSIDISSEVIIYKGSHNIGVAMDTKAGLIVPNIKSVQGKSILDIAADLSRLHQLGLKGTLGPSDLTGGTFTLSNIGSIGGTYAKPVILPPEVCIGALGRVQGLPRFDTEGNVIRANILNVSWSADHRLIDGATMARFSNLWKLYLENPSSMLLHLK